MTRSPPLSEECGESEQGGEETPHAGEETPLPGRAESSEKVSAEFLWLFEYALEMDLAVLKGFVLITWFTRPLIGSVLAVLAYLLLNSGLFVLSASVEQHHTLYSLLAMLAGACEGWLFIEENERSLS